ncbi:hypothetical protein FISHEDRAFT_71010 [Fistulina hepatica ATCC 64428]|uniref:Retrotransposon gag domain-containing protein n=1 Tax=Fistulina hepatica ATCC 64428 TaxID=1128425 RepID=A0A0D7AHP2_9AGAR|nr:hypothetical protein FISHEDRAFT_71010 [Fistulina hepatica ATCC 64428]
MGLPLSWWTELRASLQSREPSQNSSKRRRFQHHSQSQPRERGHFISLRGTRSSAPSPEPLATSWRGTSPSRLSPESTDNAPRLSPTTSQRPSSESDVSQLLRTDNEPPASPTFSVFGQPESPQQPHDELYTGNESNTTSDDDMDDHPSTKLFRGDEAFEWSLDSTGPAQEWWDTLDSAQKTSWSALRKAFEERFPPKKSVVPTAKEILQQLLENKMTEEDLLASLAPGKEPLHLVWVQKQRNVQRRKAETEIPVAFCYPEIRKTLPKAVRKFLKPEYTTWEDLWTAVEAIGRDELGDEIQDRLDERSAAASAAIMAAKSSQSSSQTPTATPTATPAAAAPGTIMSESRIEEIIARRMEAMNISTSTPARPPAPYGYYGPPQPQPMHMNPPAPRPYMPRPPRYPPLNPADLVTLRHHVDNTIYYSDSVDGKRDYEVSKEAWHRANGANTMPKFDSPYPLSPGSAQLLSYECFQCGIIHRRNRQYPEPCPKPPIPAQEAEWRRYVQTYLAPPRGPRTTPAPVNYLGYYQPSYYDNQGNW